MSYGKEREGTEREHSIQGNLKYLPNWNEAIYSDIQMALAMLENEYLRNPVEEKLELFPIL
jgi:hypothetical protein